MKCLHVNYDQDSQAIDTIENASPEAWDAVCERFDNDVRRIKAVSDEKSYSALYACYDENNQPVYYLVEEGEALQQMRRKTFFRKLGKLKT